MRFNHSVLISSFFASAVLAAPRLFRVADTQALPANSFWAGNVVTLEHGTIQYVTSTIHAPDIAGQKVGSSAIAFVSIDGAGACTSMLRLGVVFNVTTEGPSYTVVYQHDNGSKGFINGVHIAPGDAIKLTANAPVGAKLGFVTVKNLSNNQNATQQVNLTESLCGKAAEWVVENLTHEDSTSLPVNSMVNFGTLTFANAEVSGNDFGQLHSNLVNIVENGIVLTSVSADNDSISVTWL